VKYKIIATGEILTPRQIRHFFTATLFPADPARWDDALMSQLGLERVPAK
jgi:hypothetical protein